MKENNNIKKQPYINEIREIGSMEKTSYRDKRNLYLYKDKLVTAYRTFNLDNVFDISYKVIQGKGRILFVHTNHGVYTYTLETSPSSFISAFKRIKNVDYL